MTAVQTKQARTWCAYCAGHGTTVIDLDVINRMPRTVNCWACWGRGTLTDCPGCHFPNVRGRDRCGRCKRPIDSERGDR